MRRYWKGSDLQIAINIRDKKGNPIPFANVDELTIYLKTTGEEYVKVSKGSGIEADADGNIYVRLNEHSLDNLPDGLLRYDARLKISAEGWDNGYDTVQSCEADIFVKTPVNYVAKANVQEKSVTYAANGDYVLTPDEGYVGISRADIRVDIPESPVRIKMGATGIRLGMSLFTEVPDIFDCSDVTDFYGMFYGCWNLLTVPPLDTSHGKDMSYMFYLCEALQSIPELDTSQAVHMEYIVTKCTSLTNLGGFVGLEVPVNFVGCPLTHDSIMNVINKAADVSANPQTLTFGSTNLAKITDEEKSIATNKGWTLA